MSEPQGAAPRKESIRAEAIRLRRAAIGRGLTTRYTCDWCGRFYWSPLPEGSACPNHIAEHSERLRASIERFNARLANREVPHEP